ncbi:hypothetical protein GCM10017668_09330 [Streptomyces tuirus]|uniref:Uncharacterized protein n=1 Tax=Streptomyces tuirus TaxID=68278 RepID=A0A7G1NBJ5_9ACTN|nr:hypothetical protein GCM10017668_09330 [Streptomyces tuirus]
MSGWVSRKVAAAAAMFNTDEPSAVRVSLLNPPDLLRKEEIPLAGVHFPRDAKMLPAGDDPGPRD